MVETQTHVIGQQWQSRFGLLGRTRHFGLYKISSDIAQLDVITVTVDCGQHDNFNEIERKAQAIGAIKHVHIDAREEFARNFVVPSIKANGLYQGKYPLATALARPLIAAKAVEVANKEGAMQ